MLKKIKTAEAIKQKKNKLIKKIDVMNLEKSMIKKIE